MQIQLTEREFQVLEEGSLMRYAISMEGQQNYSAFADILSAYEPGIAAAMMSCYRCYSEIDSKFITTPVEALRHLISLKDVVKDDASGNIGPYTEKLNHYRERRDFLNSLKAQIKEFDLLRKAEIEKKERELNEFKIGQAKYLASLKAYLKKQKAIKADDWVNPNKA